MDLHLNLNDLQRLAVNGKVEKDGVTVVVDRPVLATLKDRAVHFMLDESDPRAEGFKAI